MDDGPRTDAPQTNRDPAEIARKRELLHSARMQPLTAYVDRLRAERTERDIPYFDPTQAGTNARVLLLLEAPGRRGATVRHGSGSISPDNADVTAKNTWTLMREAGLDRRQTLNWNVVPWYVGTSTKLDKPGAQDVIDARQPMRELLSMLPELRVVVLLGLVAQAAWPGLGIRELPALNTWHPSGQALNGHPERRSHIVEKLTEARARAGP